MTSLMDGRRPPAPKEPDSRRGALLGLLVALLLVVLGLILVRVLGNAGPIVFETAYWPPELPRLLSSLV
jgi:hypothetical protein